MNVRNFALGRRATVGVGLTIALVVGIAGWAVADGNVPLVGTPASTSSSAASPTSASGGGNTPANVAGAVNTTAGRTVIAISLKIVQTSASTVDPTNAAVAVASCTDCQTVAIALEGVLVAGSPTTFDPTNIALALNTGCTNCQTLATAYQYVVQNDTRVRISGVGRRDIAAIRRDLDSLRQSGLDISAIQQRVNADAAALYAVLQNDVYPIGRPRLADVTGNAAATTTTVRASTTTSTPATTSTSGAVTTTSSSTSTTSVP